MGKKLDSLMALKGKKFNVPEFVVVKSYADLAELLDTITEKQWKTISIRADRPLSTNSLGNLPFHPDQNLFEAIVKINYILRNRDLWVIASRGIDTSKSKIAGKYLQTPIEGFVEYFLGPGSIRSVIEEGAVQSGKLQHFVVPSPQKPTDIEHDDWLLVLNMIRRTNLEFKIPFCIEWSIYPEAIGNRNERLILWEVT